MPEITVVICTYNRSNIIKDLLDCLLMQKVGNECSYEVIVVDNNSRDNTKNLVESYMLKFQGMLHYLFEPRQGKSFALNLGIKEAKGEIIVRVDDDCLLEENYLMNLHKIFQEYGPDVGVIGGKILPKWISGCSPAWLEGIFAQPAYLNDGRINHKKIALEGALGILDYGDKPFIIDYSKNNHDKRKFYGANMAFRKKVLEQYGSFRIDKVLTQDTEICERLFEAGVKGVYAPNIRIYHKIKNSNITPGYYYKWYFNRGIHMELQDKFRRKFYHPFGIQGNLILKTIGLFIKSLWEKDLLKKTFYRCKVFFNLGQMVRLFKQNIK